MKDRPPRKRFSPGRKGPRPSGARPPRHEAGVERDSVILYGWHTVAAALANPARRIRKLTLTENAARRLAEAGIVPSVAPEIVRPADIDRLLGPDAVHQGFFAEAEPLAGPSLDALPREGLILVLDQI